VYIPVPAAPTSVVVPVLVKPALSVMLSDVAVQPLSI